MSKASRERPQPWMVQEAASAFRVQDAQGRVLGEVSFGNGPGKRLSKDEAFQMALEMVRSGEALMKASGDPDALQALDGLEMGKPPNVK